MLVCKALEIYISGQVNTLNKTLLSYASKVFCCGWQTIPNFNNTIACIGYRVKQAYNAKYDPNTTPHELTD